ncbi:MAG TPA: hypothetical protein PKY35_05305 [Candidatus Hydrogenedentes bacterium]|nr:hypothetical protein [Candidatus Hydrogenedentota bacterium]HOL76429.1 hypothetical protein [Candidatus Hydrogenedentota bacterium]HPO85467.1 hypothetical protein [Candidatus Hydrogenedentota bacterium]
MGSVKRCVCWAGAFLSLVFAVFPLSSYAEEPALPPGLAPSTSQTPEPQLPTGLGDAPDSQGPQLPSGLGEGTSPGLPPGLEDSAPGLPPGLETEPSPSATATEEAPSPSLGDRLGIPIHGFWETRAGIRTQSDYAQPADATLGETRLQLKTRKDWARATLEATADFYLDAIVEDPEFDLRQLRLTWKPLPALDIRIGRQVLTWGTGDMLFINDLFPKDWNSFFIGRDVEYLKAPGDAIRVGWYNSLLNVEFVYTPQFDPDRFITGERVSFWNPILGRHAGKHDQVRYNAPSTWFEDDEFAVRLYRSFGPYEAAVYGYSGYWKSPGGQRLVPLFQASFPKLNVYGASLRGPLGRGIANIEFGYYDSRQDRLGEDPFVNNSEFRLLLGYEQELAKEFTGAVQYYLEHMVDYQAYRNTRIFLVPPRDQDRHVFTLRLTKLLWNQNLTLSLFAYYSPSDNDAYLRPNARYKVNDHWIVECGGNVFLGESDTTFFGQFENNTNVYASVRYSF